MFYFSDFSVQFNSNIKFTILSITLVDSQGNTNDAEKVATVQKSDR